MLKISRERVLDCYKYIFILDILLKWIAMYTGIKNGMISGGVYLIYIIFILITSGYIIPVSNVEKGIIIYLLYSFTLSIITIGRGYPVNMLLSEIVNSLLPIVAFSVGKKISNEQANTFEKYFFIASLGILISGLYYNITLSDRYYIKYLGEYNPNFYLENFVKSPRLTSFVGSVVCGVYGCAITAFSFSRLQNRDNVLFILMCISGNAMAFLSFQRSALLGVIFVDFLLLIYSLRHKILNYRLFLLVAISALAIIVFISSKYPTIIIALFDRFAKLSSAVGERAGGWKNAFSHGIVASIFGYGFGTGGQRAIGLSNVTVNDGQYFSMIYDIGLIGFNIFLFIIVSSLIKSIYRKKKYVYLIAILCFMFQMMGSNLLRSFQTAVVFWYYLGRLNNSNLEEN